MASSVVVVGGGMTGLAAALEASSGGAEVTLVEAAPQVGGKVATGDLGGITVDLGAESLLNTRPEAVELVREVGLGDRIVHPATSSARLLSRGSLRTLPAGLVMGLPADLDAVRSSGALSDEGLRELDALARKPLRSVTTDTGLGAFAAQAFGDEVAQRLVDPILAGVYAGDAMQISLRAAAPALFASLATDHDAALDAVTSARRTPTVPVFAGVVGGIGSVPDAAQRVLAARGVTVATSTIATQLRTDGRGAWSIQVRGLDDEGGAAQASTLKADALVLALPAFSAEQLLATLPERQTPDAVFDAARDLLRIPYADVAVLTFAFPLDAMPEAAGSGFLVPSVERRFVKASTFSSNKWEWSGDAAAAQGLFVLRASVGRYGEGVEELLDDDLATRALADLRDLLPGLPQPEHVRVDRWQQSLPQYLVGHVDRVGRIRTGLSALPGLAVAGAAYDGIGIAACVASGRTAVKQLL
jgi:oxygen-dependent protoporphyrinogen oxidase